MTKKNLDTHLKVCLAAQRDNSDDEEDDDNQSREYFTDAETDLLSVSSTSSYNIEKLIADKKSLKDQLKQILSKYEKKKLESQDYKKQLEEAILSHKRYEEEVNHRYGQLADDLKNKIDTMKEKENKLKAREDILRERDVKAKEREDRFLTLEKEKEERFLYQEKAIAEREERMREFDLKLKQREDRVFQSETRIRELEAKVDMLQVKDLEYRQLLQNMEREKSQAAAIHLSNLSSEKENVRLQTIKQKEEEIQKMKSEHKSEVYNLKSDLDQTQKKLVRTVEQNEKILLEVKSEYEIQMQKMRTEFSRMKTEYENKICSQTTYYSGTVQMTEQKSKEESAKLTADYEAKLKQQNDSYQKVIETLQAEYNKKNKEFNENMIQLRSDIEFYKKSFSETISKKETEVKADASIKFLELKMEYENQLKMYEQDKKAYTFEYQVKEREYQDKINSLTQSVDESKVKFATMNSNFVETCKQYEQKITEILSTAEKQVQEKHTEMTNLQTELSQVRKDVETRLYHARQSNDELMKNLTKERQEKERLTTALEDMKSSYEQKLNSFRHQAENASDRATNKVEEARLALEKDYREKMTSLEVSNKELTVKYSLDTTSLNQKVEMLQRKLKSIENMLKDAHENKIKELSTRHAEEILNLSKKHEIELNYLRTDLSTAKTEIEHAQKTYEQSMTKQINHERARVVQSFSEEIEKVNTTLYQTQQEYYNFKKTSVDTLNNLRTTLLDDKKRELRELDMKYTMQIDKLADTIASERSLRMTELDALKQKKDQERKQEIESLQLQHQKEMHDLTDKAEKEFQKLKMDLKKAEDDKAALTREHQAALKQVVQEKEDLSSQIVQMRVEKDADMTNLKREFERRYQEKDESYMARLKEETGKLRKQNQETTSKYTFEINKLLQEIELLTQNKRLEMNEMRSSLEETEREVERIRKNLDDYKLYHSDTVKKMAAEKEKILVEIKQKDMLEEKLKTKDEQLKVLFEKISALSEENMILKTQKHQEIENLQKEKSFSISEKEQEMKILEDTLKNKYLKEFELQKLSYEETISQLLKKNQLEHIKLDHDKRIASLTENFNLEKRALADSIAASFLAQINDLKEKLTIIDVSRKEAVQRLEEFAVEKNIHINETHLLKTKLLEMDSLRKVIDDQKAQIDKLTLTCDKLSELNEQYISQKSEIQQRLDQTTTLNEIFKKQIKLTSNKDEYKKTVDKLIVENLKLKQLVDQLQNQNTASSSFKKL